MRVNQTRREWLINTRVSHGNINEFCPCVIESDGSSSNSRQELAHTPAQSDKEHDFCEHRAYDPEFSLNASQHVAFQSLELSKRNQLQYSH